MPATPRTLIEEHRWLLRLFGAATLAPVLLFAAAMGAMLLWVGLRAGGGGAAAAACVAVGVVYWTFVEYALHRWLYHWTPRHRGLRRVVESFHVYHHRTPDDRAVWNAGPALVVLLTTLLSLPPLALLGGVAAAAFVMLGAVVAYAIYEVVHHECHARVHTRGPLVYLQAFHLRHHQRNWRRNFGVTNPFWDWVFGTLAPTGREK
jgi:sterol desaturase/sphingolipid hydroxylase (fatty acid hydroxylase superfamily)